MGQHESDSAEIDLLVRELTAKPLVSPKASGAVGPALGPADPAHGPAPLAVDPFEPRPGSRWSNGHLMMPSLRTRSVAERLASARALVAPYVPDVTPYLRLPGPVAMVRIWVGLGALYSASMTFWPYPKTYLWGMLFYLLCLALVLVAGIWGARMSWEARLGAAHTIALSTVLWAVTLATTETLPPA